MTPLIPKFSGVLMLVLVLGHSVHVLGHSIDGGFQLRANGVPGPNDYHLTFSNRWDHSKNLLYSASPMQLRCYAILGLNKISDIVLLKTFHMELYQSFSMAFRVVPHFFRFGWRIQCDYRYRAATLEAMRMGVVLEGGSGSRKCLKRNGGCEIVFTYGEVRRHSRLGGWEFLGELFEKICLLHWRRGYCWERDHPRHLFGYHCSSTCYFPCIRNCDKSYPADPYLFRNHPTPIPEGP